MEGAEGQGNNGPQGYHGATGAEAPGEIPKISVSLLNRIMYQALPRSSFINADAKEAMSRCVTEFMAVLIREAARVAREESRATVSGDDIITALVRLGLGDYVAPLSLFLHRYRESQGIVPRSWQAPPAPAAVVAAQVEIPPAAVEEMLQPPEPDLTLGLALPGPRDVTELGLQEDVYKVWPRGGGAGAMPPPGDNEQRLG